MQEEQDIHHKRYRLAAVLSNYFYAITLLLASVCVPRFAWTWRCTNLASGRMGSRIRGANRGYKNRYVTCMRVSVLFRSSSGSLFSLKVGHEAVGVMWFAVFLQLFLILGVFGILASGDMSAFRLQACAFSILASVFAVIGVDMSIFAGQPARSAMAGGWLVLSAVDILWVLLFSAEPHTPFAQLVESMGVGSGRALNNDTERQASSTQSSNGKESKFSESEIASDGSPDATKIGHDARGEHDSSPEISKDWTGMGRQKIVDRTQDTVVTEENEGPDGAQNHSFPPPSSKNRRAVYIEEPRPLSVIYDHTEGTGEEEDSRRESANLYPFRVRARSDCTHIFHILQEYHCQLFLRLGIPRSPSEISFKKGDILHSAEKEGKKWWKVKKVDGTVGCACHNVETRVLTDCSIKRQRLHPITSRSSAASRCLYIANSGVMY